MVSVEDCIAFCGLDEDEVAAISEHEHIPEIAATALADYLLKQPHGGETIRTMIIDDIHAALNAGRVKHAQELLLALRHFRDQHPEARAGVE
jgi:predicted restriction endonuclease